MKMIEIAALSNGAHRNQTFSGVLPVGWAIDRNNLCVENFPFGEVETEEVNGMMTVTKWTPGTIPEPDPIPEVDPEPTIDDRVTVLEDQLAQTDETLIEIYEMIGV
jgi:hypothetical protein